MNLQILKIHLNQYSSGWGATQPSGTAGAKLEKATSTLFAAMQIYDVSSPISVSPVRFFEDNATALEDMKKCAELEAQQQNS